MTFRETFPQGGIRDAWGWGLLKNALYFFDCEIFVK